jgi:hypothetical protein
MEARQGAIAPARIDKLPSGITSSGSTSMRVPSPLQELHMPSGLLNENDWGLRAGKLCPQHMRFSLKVRRSLLPCSRADPRASASPSSSIQTSPLPSRSALSTLSVRRG